MNTTIFDVELDPDFTALRDTVRDFALWEVAPIAQKLHMAGEELPDALVEKMRTLGIYGVATPEVEGGSGLGALGAAIVTEELSRSWMSAGYLPLYNWSLIRLLQAFGTQDQKRRWLPGLVDGRLQAAHAGTEALAGSDAAALQLRAERVDSHYRLTGSKLWCTHASRADLITVMCRTDREGGHGGISMLVMEKTRGEQFMPPRLAGHRLDTVGARGIHSYALFFDGVEVPEENLLGGVEGQGFKQLMAAYEFARMHCVFASVGLARAAFEASLDHSRTRKQFGRRIGDFQAIGHKLADMATGIVAARELGHLVARRIDAGRRCDMEAGMAKLFASEMAQKVCRDAVQIHGGMGYAMDSPVARYWCDSGLATIGDGTSEIQREVIARRLLKD